MNSKIDIGVMLQAESCYGNKAEIKKCISHQFEEHTCMLYLLFVTRFSNKTVYFKANLSDSIIQDRREMLITSLTVEMTF